MAGSTADVNNVAMGGTANPPVPNMVAELPVGESTKLFVNEAISTEQHDQFKVDSAAKLCRGARGQNGVLCSIAIKTVS